MTEAQLQTKFNRYMINEWYKNGGKTFMFELKITHKDSIPFSAIKEHQLRNLKNAKHRCIVYKIVDIGPQEKPFDGFVVCKEDSFLGIMFYKPGEKKVYMIDIDVMLDEIGNSKRRSLTEKKADEIKSFIVYLKE